MGLAKFLYCSLYFKNYQPKPPAPTLSATNKGVKDQEDAKRRNPSNSRKAEKESDSKRLRPLTVQLSNNEY
jgi:hypothetical protein